MRNQETSSKYGALIVVSAMAVAVFVMILASSCRPLNSMGQVASYPPGSDPFGRHWQYRMFIDTWTEGQVTLKNEKDVAISIQNPAKAFLLHDRLQLTAASIRAKVAWKRPDYVEVRLLEEGNEFTAERDSYNEALVASGPRELETIAYRQDPDTGKFQRVK